MNKVLLCILLTMYTLYASSQQIYLEKGKTISFFDYKNSEGNSLDNLLGSINNSMGLGYRTPISQSKWHFSAGASYNSYGAEGSDQILGNHFTWDITYLGANLGIDYEFFKDYGFMSLRSGSSENGFTFYLKGSVATEFFIQGTQLLNDQAYNLIGEEQFKKPIFFLRGGIGVTYYISNGLSIFAQYMGGKTILIKFGDSDNQEELRYVVHNFCLSISFSIIN